MPGFLWKDEAVDLLEGRRKFIDWEGLINQHLRFGL